MLKTPFSFQIILILILSSTLPHLTWAAPKKKNTALREAEAAAALSYTSDDWYSKWSTDPQLHIELSAGGISTRSISGAHPLTPTTQLAGEVNAWFAQNFAVYGYLAIHLFKMDATTLGGGFKLPLTHFQIGDVGGFINGLMVYLASDYSALSYPRPLDYPAEFSEKTGVIRYGLGTYLGIGPSSAYLNFSIMFFNTGNVTYIAPSAYIGYSL